MTSVRELPPSVVIPKNIEIGYWAKVAQGRIGSEQDERKRREGKKRRPHTPLFRQPSTLVVVVRYPTLFA